MTNSIIEDYKKAIDFINNNEIFWISELRLFMGCNNADSANTKNHRLTRVLQVLRKTNTIQCCEKKGQNRQYLIVNPKLQIEYDIMKNVEYTIKKINVK